jgi:AcrR family transcriptional regulator
MARTRSTDGRADARPVSDRILDAAIQILRQRGVRRLTQVQVSRLAGVRQSHLTYYFPKREDLLEAVTSRIVGGIAERVREVAARAGEDGRAAMLGRLTASVLELEHMRMFIGMAIEADADPSVRRLMVRATRHMEEVLAEVLGGARAEEAVRVVLAAAWGLGLYCFVMRPSRGADPTDAYLAWLDTVTS